ncbi:MAG: S-layer homology domain-containing protein, partial [Eubacteriales bacterium]|nr:S-layer homology domain-containing protein [Eubacteriales bacterium]
MKKRLTACLLALVMLCAAIPAMATKGPEDVDRQGNAIVSAERAASSSDSAQQGILIEKTSEMAASGKLVEPKLLSQEEHEALVENAEPAAEFTMSQNYSAQRGEFDADVSYAEKRTTNFTTYGAQLPNLVYYAGNKKIDVGPVLQRLYNNIKADLAKGTNSAVFRGETDAVKKLGVSFQLPGVSAKHYEDIVRALGWRVYLCLDSDCPEMFYSNGFCSMGFDPGLNGTTITMYIIPGYRAGFTTLYQRTTLKKQLDTKVNELVAESQSYATAYEKMAFFHDWLCENNSYNNEAAQSSVGTYSANISGTPWSSASALLSSTNSSVKTPVCEGYSRAFQLLCQKVGITATVISSTSGNHMWNNVKYGTTWTGVDITWDDGSGSSYTHDYFCRAINGISGHTMDDQYFVDWLYYPSLSSITSKAVLPYYDVPDNYWGRSMVQYVYDNEYMVGVTCAKFGPDIRVTRSQFVRILYNLAGQPEVEYSAQFLDVPDGKWYTDAVIWAYENQVTAGYDNGCFGVNDEITREQMTKMLCDYCGGVQPDEPEDDTPGDDNPVDKPSDNPEDTTGNTPTDTTGNTPDDTTTDTTSN